MMRIIFTLVFLLVGCGKKDLSSTTLNSDNAVPSSEETKKIETICGLISENPVFNYEDLFAKTITQTTSQDIFAQLFKQQFKSHGQCLGTEIPSFPRGEGDSLIFYLKMSDKIKAVFTMALDKTSQKIFDFYYKGTLHGSDYLEVSEISVPMRDGTNLRTFIVKRKDQVGPLPTVLNRTPYLLTNGLFEVRKFYETGTYFVDRGYVFIFQAIRGTFGSEGEYKIFSPQEIDDAYDTIAWITKQEFSNGKVATHGISYEGFTSLCAGISNAPGLKVVFAGGAPSNIMTDAFFGDGILMMHTLPYIHYNETGQGAPFPADMGKYYKDVYSKLLNEPDLTKYDEIIYGKDLKEWDLYAENFADLSASFWKERQVHSRIPEIAIPTYHIGGMELDGDMPDVVRNFVKSQESPVNRDFHHLILGYWGHGNSMPYNNGENASTFIKERFDSLLDYYMKDLPSPYINEPRVRMASNFSNDFLSSNGYPMSGLKQKTFYFNKSDDKYSIDENEKSTVSESIYQFKPLEYNDLQTSGGDQYLAFSEVAKEDLPILGEMSFDLYLKINTPQTDLIILPFSKDKDGNDKFVTNCMTGSRIYNKGEIVHFTINTCPIMHQIKQGETFGFYLTSNLFPQVVRNTNNGLDNYFGSFSSSTITLLHSEQYPSKVVLSLEK